jgi:hypothetical protein
MIFHYKKVMEIKELVSYFLNSDSNILEVSFRTIDDDEEVLRTDEINYELVEEYGYELETETFDFFDEDEDFEDIIENEKVELDEEQLISFLNEYYTVNSHILPQAEIY